MVLLGWCFLLSYLVSFSNRILSLSDSVGHVIIIMDALLTLNNNNNLCTSLTLVNCVIVSGLLSIAKSSVLQSTPLEIIMCI